MVSSRGCPATGPRRRPGSRPVAQQPPDLADHAGSIATRLGVDEPHVRSLLTGWWQWAGMVAQRGGVMDTDAFLDQRQAEGLLELPRDLAERAIELDVALLHGRAAARRPAPSPRPPAARRRAARQPSQVVVGTIAFGSLAVLVGGGIGLAQVVDHVPLP